MKINSKRLISLLEHYAYATLAAGLAIWQSGNHNIKEVAWAALIGVLGPVLAHINPKSLINTIAKEANLDAETTAVLEKVAEPVVEAAIAKTEPVKK